MLFKIKQALIQTSTSYEPKNWQRAVKYKYGLHPLSTVGSLGFIGGRFNTGAGVNPEVPFFSGLYLAQDKDTALQEHLGQEASPDSKITPRELALTNPASETIVSVSGKLDKIFDLTNSDNLIPFVELIKKFKLSKELMVSASKLSVVKPGIVQTAKSLLKTLLNPDWRALPSNYDVPANSQIFGHLVYSSGIEGILYPSKFTKIPCLVIFPRNFVGTDSFIILDDDVPHPKVPCRLDASNWRISEMDAKEVMGVNT
ncbi:MAG: RES family NAD+ phosphorylase [Gammaproteobacteria bacterium]|nr:RES family NAD+ phosphorylase [Gammaproteobacteria bacterium]